MDASATVTAKGQVTIPKQVRDELGLHEGDRLLFRVIDGRAVLARTADLLDLAGVVPVPADARDLSWDEVRGDRIVVRYYLVRDLYLFGGLTAIGAVLGAVGLSYFWLQLRTIQRRREEVGLDVETGGDDSGPGPF